MPIFLRRSDSDMPDYSVMYRADDGREMYVGRIFKPNAIKGLPWMWTVEFHQRKGRAEPHQGPCPDRRRSQGGVEAVLGKRRRADPVATIIG